MQRVEERIYPFYSLMAKVELPRLSDKSLDRPQRFVLVALKVAKMVLVGEFEHLQEP